MKKIKCILIFFIILFFITFSLRGELQGIAIPPPINSLVNAKPMSMAGTYIAYSDDINGILYNPAGLVFSDHNQFNITINKYIGEITKSTVGILYNNKNNYAISIMGNYYFFKLDQTDGYGIKVGEIVNEDIISLLGVSWRFKKSNSFGISFKYMYSSIGYYSHKFLFLDYGYYHKMSNINIGIVIKNIGLLLDNKELIIPTLNVGILKKIKEINLLIGIDIKYDIIKKFSGSIGIEYNIIKGIFLRSGYRINNTSSIYTYGIGIKTFFINKATPLIIDCGIAQYGYLGESYTISLRFNF